MGSEDKPGALPRSASALPSPFSFHSLLFASAPVAVPIMATPSSSSGPSSAVTADAIHEKWIEWEIARHSLLKVERLNEAAHKPGHASRVAKHEKREETKWKELTSMLDNSDLETAKAALRQLTECRNNAQGEIDRIKAQNPAASGLQRLQDEVDAADFIIPHFEEHIEGCELVSSSSDSLS